jgi:hypothetical protein
MFAEVSVPPTSLYAPEFQAVLDQAVHPPTPASAPFPSPIDWRDRWIYFLMLDRFNNGAAAPRHQPFDDPNFYGFQGGKFSGVQEQLAYIKQLGAGAIWLSPVLKNFSFDPNTYHGYGIHNFIAAEPRFADNRRRPTMNFASWWMRRISRICWLSSTLF